MIRHQLPHGEIVHARVEAVYPTIASGSVTLCHVDGPYGMGKAAWDRVKDLAGWYRPHIAEWGRLCAPSASVYLWNTAEGWAAIHPEMAAAGWKFRRLIVWDKLNTAASMAWEKSDTWPDTHEVCGVYVRGEAHFSGQHARSVWPMAVQGYASERLTTGETRAGARNQNGVPCMVAVAVHPCQKPLLFARRIVEASSRPGDLVFEPFGGTCRIAAACEAIGRHEPENARRYVCVEMDEDGKGYVPAVLASLRGELRTGQGTAQAPLFGAAK